jgi:hypothetical protein
MKSVIKKILRENFVNKSTVNEGLFIKNKLSILQITDFINFAKKNLNIDDDIQVELAFEKTPLLRTTAYYTNDKIVVYVKERAIIDIMRSIAHELVHHKQFLDGKLNDIAKDDMDGSPIENEANAVAGKLIRIYGRLHPEIYI